MILSATANVTSGENKKQKTKNRTTYFMQAADVTWWTESVELLRLQGRATCVQQEVRGKLRCGGSDWGTLKSGTRGSGRGGYTFACWHRHTYRYKLAIASEARCWRCKLSPLRLWAVPFGIWRKGWGVPISVMALCCGFLWAEVREDAEAKLGPVIFTVTKGELGQIKRMNSYTQT